MEYSSDLPFLEVDMKLVKIALTGTWLFGLCTSASALEIKSVTAAGTACKANDGISVTASSHALHVALPDLKSQAAGKRIVRANCSISVNILDNGTRQFRPTKAIVLHDTIGTKADDLTFNISTWIQGKTETTGSQIKLSPGTGLKTEVAISNASWSPCSKDVVYNMSLAVLAKNKGGLGPETGVVFKDNIAIEWEWQPCKP